MTMPEAAVPTGGENLTDDMIIRYLRSQSWPVISTEVADAFDVTQQAAYQRLVSLRERGRVEREKKNPMTVLWRATAADADGQPE
jgi:predicted ArsR family transcriptional regulator